MITLIHGPAELLRAEALDALRRQLAAEPDLADLNITRLEGARVSVAEVQNACDTLPFLAERRLIIVEGLLRRLAAPGRGASKGGETSGGDDQEGERSGESGEPVPAKGQAKALQAYLDHIPASTELVFMEEDTVGGGPILRRLLELQRDRQAQIVLCAKPRRNELPDWLRGRAKERGVRLEPAALADLAEFVGDDLRQLDQELIKLRHYAGPRTVTREDVRRLVAATRAASVFDLVDALGMGDDAAAGQLMQHALDNDGEQPLRLLGMIARQYRLLILAKALQAQGLRQPDIAREVGVPDWTAPRLLSQATRHTFARLERAMERIAATDETIKTGKLTDREALDVLLAELTQDI